MDDLAKILPTLPSWISLPIICLTIVVTLWPKLLQFWKDLSSSQRTHDSEKKRLELLKLKYEIEAIKKQVGLENLADDTGIVNTKESDESRFNQKKKLLESFGMRFSYGALGLWEESHARQQEILQ